MLGCQFHTKCASQTLSHRDQTNVGILFLYEIRQLNNVFVTFFMIDFASIVIGGAELFLLIKAATTKAAHIHCNKINAIYGKRSGENSESAAMQSQSVDTKDNGFGWHTDRRPFVSGNAKAFC